MYDGGVVPTEPEPERSTAAALIDALLAGGEPVDEGGFTLDAGAAATKLDAYQYADRSGYLIAIVEGVRALGAKLVVLTESGADLLIVAEGVTLGDPVGFLADPFTRTHGAGDRHGRGLVRLGVGLHMALGYNSIARVALSYSTVPRRALGSTLPALGSYRDTSSTGSDGAQMIAAEYRPGVAPRLVRRSCELGDELQIFIDRPWADRLSIGGASRTELDRLRAAVRRGPILLGGEPLRDPSPAIELSVRSSGPGFGLVVGLEARGEHDSTVELCTEGLCVETIVLPSLGSRAVIDLEAPRRDLSQSKIVRDEVVTAALAAAEQADAEVRAQLAERDRRWTPASRPANWTVGRVDRILGRAPRSPDLEHLGIRGVRLVRQLRPGMKSWAVGVVFGAYSIDMLGDRSPEAASLALLFVVGFVVLALGFVLFGAHKASAGLELEPRRRVWATLALAGLGCASMPILLLLARLLFP